jgi:hypothetical protein
MPPLKKPAVEQVVLKVEPLGDLFRRRLLACIKSILRFLEIYRVIFHLAYLPKAPPTQIEYKMRKLTSEKPHPSLFF